MYKKVNTIIRRKWENCNRKKQLIQYKYKKILYRCYRNDDIKELTLLEEHEKRLNNMKHVRAIYLYVNRNLLSLFSFDRKFIKFLSCIEDKSKYLIKQMEDTKDESVHFEKELNYSNLLKKTIAKINKRNNKTKFFEYGCLIKKSLHRNFCPDIVQEICSYI